MRNSTTCMACHAKAQIKAQADKKWYQSDLITSHLKKHGLLCDSCGEHKHPKDFPVQKGVRIQGKRSCNTCIAEENISQACSECEELFPIESMNNGVCLSCEEEVKSQEKTQCSTCQNIYDAVEMVPPACSECVYCMLLKTKTIDSQEVIQLTKNNPVLNEKINKFVFQNRDKFYLAAVEETVDVKEKSNS